MRPEKLDEILGQKHLINEGMPINRMIKADRISSIILWGPPGTGKTSIAEVIGKETKYNFKKINAVTAGIGEIKNIIDETRNILFNPTGKSILFIDEIHRFNKLQQDVLLPAVESGEIILIGATTENPYFEINKALISRATIFKLKSLETEDIVKGVKRALTSPKGLKEYDVEITDENIEKLAILSGGDIRNALKMIEVLVLSTDLSSDGRIRISEEDIKNIVGEKQKLFDKSADEHYDNISALIKSIRGSDADATVHYLAKIIASGEDPMFIARRLIISAAEDIGLANPKALEIAVATANAVKMIGMPEGRIVLSECAIYLAKSKKSNAAYLAINQALHDVENTETGDVPMHLRNAPYEEMKNLGYKEGYKYPHDYKDGIVEQQYLPDKIKDKKYYIDKWGNDIYE